jgi:hypothetical protein
MTKGIDYARVMEGMVVERVVVVCPLRLMRDGVCCGEVLATELGGRIIVCGCERLAC